MPDRSSDRLRHEASKSPPDGRPRTRNYVLSWSPQLLKLAAKTITKGDLDKAILCTLQALTNISKDQLNFKYPAFLRSLGLSFQHRAEITY